MHTLKDYGACTMKHSLLDILCCIKCSDNLFFKENILAADKNEIESGVLACEGCGTQYPIINGVPVFQADALDQNVTAKAFSEQWSAHKNGLFEKNDVFGFTENDYISHFCYAFDIRNHHSLKGVIIEAGIGSGCLAYTLAKESPQSIVVAIDISNSVFALSYTARELPNLHLIQCDLANPPIKKGTADKVYSSGVLHHTENPSIGLSRLWSLLNNKGELYFWVYPSYVHCAYDWLRKILGHPYKWTSKVRYSLSWILAPIMWAYFFSTKRYSYKQSQETVGTIAFRIFDNISPEFQHRISKNEVAAWCNRAGIKSFKIINDLGVLCSHGS